MQAKPALVTNLLCLSLLAACGIKQASPSTPIRARILSSQDGVYSLRDVNFSTLVNVEHMQGSLGTILGHASASVDADPSEIIAASNPDGLYRKRGQTVHLDYIVKNGTVIPQSFASMEMLGLYYNFERTVMFWQEQLGLDFTSIGLPRLFYNPSLSRSKNGQEEKISEVMNAAYLSGIKDLWFYQTSPREKIPVKMNFGIVAHEFGHYIFDYAFAKFEPAAYETNLLSNSELLSGMNEGIADFFSYMVAGNAKEFAKSLPELEAERSLPVSWTLSTLRSAACEGGHYCRGSILASALYEISQSPGQSAIAVGKNVLANLPYFQHRWESEAMDELVDESLLLTPLLTSEGVDKSLYCKVFLKWFDTKSLQSNLPCNT